MKLAERFKEAIKKSTRPLYLLGPSSGFHPSRLSRLKNGEEVKRPHDIRFRLLAKAVSYDGELFEEPHGGAP